ncbi:MAG: ParB/RepB/Spo0J family partition protein [Pseudomonadota bacterium]
MSDDIGKRRLGRGLAALMGETVPESLAVDRVRPPRLLPIDQIAPNPGNPRQTFEVEDLKELTASVREKGIIQPLLVRTLGEGSYELIAGERRWRAAQQAGLDTVPVVVRDVDERESLEIAIIENVQRADLNAVEEAEGYQQLIDKFDYTQKALADVIGKSRSHIANTLRLLKLPKDVLGFVSNGRLSAGHARQLIDRDDAPDLARQVISDGLSVRELEKMVQAGAAVADASQRPVSGAGGSKTAMETADTRAIEERLGERLGLQVKLKARPNGSGSLQISYRSLDELDGLLRAMGAID